MKHGDFIYNGIPIFNVGFLDFSTMTESLPVGTRFLSRNIISDDLREYFRSNKHSDFGICYEGIIIDLRNLKKS